MELNFASKCIRSSVMLAGRKYAHLKKRSADTKLGQCSSRLARMRESPTYVPLVELRSCSKTAPSLTSRRNADVTLLRRQFPCPASSNAPDGHQRPREFAFDTARWPTDDGNLDRFVLWKRETRCLRSHAVVKSRGAGSFQRHRRIHGNRWRTRRGIGRIPQRHHATALPASDLCGAIVRELPFVQVQPCTAVRTNNLHLGSILVLPVNC